MSLLCDLPVDDEYFVKVHTQSVGNLHKAKGFIFVKLWLAAQKRLLINERTRLRFLQTGGSF